VDRQPGMPHCFHTVSVTTEGRDAILVENCCWCGRPQTVIGAVRKGGGHGPRPQIHWGRPGVFDGVRCAKRPAGP